MSGRKVGTLFKLFVLMACVAGLVTWIGSPSYYHSPSWVQILSWFAFWAFTFAFVDVKISYNKACATEQAAKNKDDKQGSDDPF